MAGDPLVNWLTNKVPSSWNWNECWNEYVSTLDPLHHDLRLWISDIIKYAGRHTNLDVADAVREKLDEYGKAVEIPQQKLKFLAFLQNNITRIYDFAHNQIHL